MSVVETSSSSAPQKAGDAFTRDRFLWLAQVLADRELTPIVLHVALVLDQHVNRQTHEAWPSQARICELLKISLRSVQNAIDQLVRGGHLQVIASSNRNGGNHYRPLLKEGVVALSHVHEDAHENPSHMHERAHDNDSHVHGCAHAMCTLVHTNSLNELSEKRSISQAAKPRAHKPKQIVDEGGFADAYAAFPRHVARDDAQRAYSAALQRGAKPEDILAGVRRYAVERAGKDIHYTSHMATWLNKGRWTDGIESVGATGRTFEYRGVPIPEVRIRSAASDYRARGEGWPDVWGPAPGQPGCVFPAHLIFEERAA